jgi:formylglycine-generating enzyme required for sulfatase activity
VPCVPPLVSSPLGCTADDSQIVTVPETRVLVGPSDWEAEGRVPPRTVSVASFRIDRYEVAIGRACASLVFANDPLCSAGDAARAAFGVTLDEARAYCRARGGRLPTEDEWLAAAGGDRPRRYPWGDTGAVCRRAAWGLESGPCAEGARGPDSVGAHPDGATPLGIEDIAGNVAEWVEAQPAPVVAVVRGGSWRTRLATDLRTWSRREAPAAIRDPTIGFRCAYGGVP